ncbi:hypothetical protein FACS189459_6710 [Bacilli bacterium]|nr:hypothetical protein FACS189459_6710 [Bacilli bacterium]
MLIIFILSCFCTIQLFNNGTIVKITTEHQNTIVADQTFKLSPPINIPRFEDSFAWFKQDNPAVQIIDHSPTPKQLILEIIAQMLCFQLNSFFLNSAQNIVMPYITNINSTIVLDAPSKIASLFNMTHGIPTITNRTATTKK